MQSTVKKFTVRAGKKPLQNKALTCSGCCGQAALAKFRLFIELSTLSMRENIKLIRR